MNSLLPALAEGLQPWLDLPFAFFGHSMGALIAFELARWLRQHREITPAQLFLSAHRWPRLPRRNPPVHHLPDKAFVSELRRLNGTPEEVLQNPELLSLLMRSMRADFALCETYAYEPGDPLPTPITVLGGAHDPEVSPAELEGWAAETQGAFRVQLFAGGHFYVRTCRTRLLQVLNQALTPASLPKQ